MSGELISGLIEMVTRVSGSAKVLTFPAGSGRTEPKALTELTSVRNIGLPDSEFTPCLYWFCGQPVSIHTGFRCAASNQIVCEICVPEHIDGGIGETLQGKEFRIEGCKPCQERRNWERLSLAIGAKL